MTAPCGLLAIGNVLLWWAGIAAWVVLGLLAVLRRDWRLGMAPALVAVLYLPVAAHLAADLHLLHGPGRAVHRGAGRDRSRALRRCAVDAAARAIVGCRCDLTSGVAGDARRVRRAPALAWAFCAACVVVGALYVPFVLGLPVPFEYYAFLTPFTTWK